jgi:peptide/nickel transport system ATP-binding protein
MTKHDAAPLIEIKDLERKFDVSKSPLSRFFNRGQKQYLKAVDGVSLEIPKGETLSIVGESGCGKSTMAKLVVGLDFPTAGSISFEGHDLSKPEDFTKFRSRWQMIFQDPYASLNPRWRVRDIIAEPMREFHPGVSRVEVDDVVGDLLTKVGLSPKDAEKFPHEFSGGQRQRISIARALSSEPEFLVCDEPTSALDVSVQAQILNLMKELQERLGLTYLFISHDLAVVHHISTKIGVMYLGRICEVADADDLFRAPLHPYTRMLLETIPKMDTEVVERVPVSGEVPNPINAPSGCTFHPRCPFATDRCKQEAPALRDTGRAKVACHAVEEDRLPPANRTRKPHGKGVQNA